MVASKITLNDLQARTLALLQGIAKDPEMASRDEASGAVTVSVQTHGHGDHLHVGPYTVSTRFASGLTNENVWKALERKGLIKSMFPHMATLSAEALAFNTGYHADLEHSDH